MCYSLYSLKCHWQSELNCVLPFTDQIPTHEQIAKCVAKELKKKLHSMLYCTQCVHWYKLRKWNGQYGANEKCISDNNKRHSVCVCVFLFSTLNACLVNNKLKRFIHIRLALNVVHSRATIYKNVPCTVYNVQSHWHFEEAENPIAKNRSCGK